MSSRGVVIGWNVGRVGPHAWYIPRLDPLLLRQCALYFDIIDYPILKGRDADIEPDVDALRSVGKLIRSEVPIPRGTAGQFLNNYLLGQITALGTHNAEEPGQWSFAQPGSQLIADSQTPRAPTLIVELYQALPIPAETARMEDILAFRARRQDELGRFRLAIDETYQHVIGSGDIPHAKTQAVDRLTQSLVDIHRVMAEGRLGRVQATTSLAFNLWDMIDKAAKGAIAAAAIGVPLALGAAVGTVASAIRFNVALAPRVPDLPAELKDFAYVFHAGTELARSGQVTTRRSLPAIVDTSEQLVIDEMLLLVAEEAGRRADLVRRAVKRSPATRS